MSLDNTEINDRALIEVCDLFMRQEGMSRIQFAEWLADELAETNRGRIQDVISLSRSHAGQS